MVCATLREVDPKRQTRRVMKQATGQSLSVDMDEEAPGIATLSWLSGAGPGYEVDESISFVACPYGKPGDRLYVKETFFAWGRWETRFSAKKKRDEWHFVDMTLESGEIPLYAADGFGNTLAFIKRRSDQKPMYWKRPAIFMPRWASRITLEITEVRVQLLNSISESDARAEGITDGGCLNCGNSELSCGCLNPRPDARDAFISLWESINGPGPGSWDANPHVWAITYRRVL